MKMLKQEYTAELKELAVRRVKEGAATTRYASFISMKNIFLNLFVVLCIFSKSNPAHAILNGVELSNYPHLPLVVIEIKTVDFRYPICSGTLININTVVTAAHCFNKMKKINTISVTRTTNIYGTNKTSQQISKNQIHIYPLYDARGVESTGDVAVIKLSEGFPDMADVYYPTLSAETEFEKYHFYGYGRDENKLRGQLKAISKTKDKRLPVTKLHSHLLKFDQSDLHGTSGGDMGGPVFAAAKGVGYLIAVANTVSSKPNGLLGSGEGYFTKLTPEIIKWIKSYM